MCVRLSCCASHGLRWQGRVGVTSRVHLSSPQKQSPSYPTGSLNVLLVATPPLSPSPPPPLIVLHSCLWRCVSPCRANTSQPRHSRALRLSGSRPVFPRARALHFSHFQDPANVDSKLESFHCVAGQLHDFLRGRRGREDIPTQSQRETTRHHQELNQRRQSLESRQLELRSDAEELTELRELPSGVAFPERKRKSSR